MNKDTLLHMANRLPEIPSEEFCIDKRKNDGIVVVTKKCCCRFMRFYAIMQPRPYKNSFYVGKTYIDFSNLLLSLFI
jgi:nitrate reductase beta subunit